MAITSRHREGYFRVTRRRRSLSQAGARQFLRVGRRSFGSQIVSRIYWDTMLFIYWLEDHPRYGHRVQQIFERMRDRQDRLCTSTFAVGETLVGFHKRGAIDMAARVRNFFRQDSVEV